MRVAQRNWRTSPPPDRGLSAVEGAAVLKENAAGLGELFWDAARDVIRWATSRRTELWQMQLAAPATEPMRLAALMSIGSSGEELTEAMEIVLAVTGLPLRADRELTAAACRQVAQWADARGDAGTAYVFAHAATITCPDHAGLAYEAGRLARLRADYARAEVWLTRAILLGRQSADWSTYARAWSGLGNVFGQRGSYSRARRCHHKCLRVAVRHGMRELEGNAAHDLLLISAELGTEPEATLWARRAFDAYGPNHRKIPYLAHDVAYIWVTAGQFELALPVLEAMLARFTAPTERLLVLGNLVRSAGAMNDADRFEWGWEQAWELTQNDPDASCAVYLAESLLSLAHGAASIREWDRAHAAAEEAIRVARFRRESRVLLTAEALLEDVIRSRSAMAVPATSEAEREEDEAGALAEDFVMSLTARGAGVG